MNTHPGIPRHQRDRRDRRAIAGQWSVAIIAAQHPRGSGQMQQIEQPPRRQLPIAKRRRTWARV